MARGYFITGTDTEIGKTYCSSLLLRAAAEQGYRAVGMKPVAAGVEALTDGSVDNPDVAALQAASSAPAERALCNPYCFSAPISPHLAAADAGRPIELAHIVACYQQLCSGRDLVLVEAAGGWLAPLGERETMADLALALQLPVILVVGMRLGCLNHAQLSAETIARSGAPLAGWIANQLSPDMPRYHDNLRTLQQRLAAPLLGEVAYGARRLPWPGDLPL